MGKTKLTFTFVLSLFFGNMVGHADKLSDRMDANIATEHNLSTFELIAPELSDQDLLDLKANDEIEANEALQKLFYDHADSAGDDTKLMIGANRITAEIFQNAASIGKQFLLVRDGGRIRYVFAVSAGMAGRSTPVGTYGVTKRNWRHMSSTYPGRGENNMDHVTYFKPSYGFHATTFGAYAKLGRRDSHGCVRLARPQARAVFSLIKAYGGATIYVYGTKDVHESEVRTVQKMLANDLNYIQSMLKSGNKGDVPFEEYQYYQYLSGQLSAKTVKDMLSRKGIKQLLEVDEGRDRYPRG